MVESKIIGGNFMYLALGIVSLFLTGFMLIYYAYLFRNTDHDVSFFISVGVISMVMNLFTNMSEGARVLSVLYLIIAAAFLGLGWAVSAEGSVGFYTSIGPWWVKTFTDKNVALNLVSFILAPVGIVLFFVNYKSNRELALSCGKAGIWGLLIWLILIWMIFGII